MRHCFPYRLEESKLTPAGRILRPVVEVEVQTARGDWFKVFPYLDSGADISVFPSKAGDLIGLDPGGGKPLAMSGIGGEVKVRIYLVRVRVAGVGLEVPVAFPEKVKVPYLLGRMGVWEAFDVEFREREVCLNRR